MPPASKTLRRILSGASDASIRFDDLTQLLRTLEFGVRIRGDHHIFSRDGILDIINLQPLGRMAKIYQARQVGRIILKYHLEGELDGQV